MLYRDVLDDAMSRRVRLRIKMKCSMMKALYVQKKSLMRDRPRMKIDEGASSK